MKEINQKEASKIVVVPQSSGELIVLLQKCDAIGIDKQGALQLIEILKEFVNEND